MPHPFMQHPLKKPKCSDIQDVHAVSLTCSITNISTKMSSMFIRKGGNCIYNSFSVNVWLCRLTL